MPARALL
jgi:hypothetical protein